MARQERPIDPTAGPLPAFAYELRKLRAEAGNPTYRVLARSAGYSATTLSEAAGGIRMPTLDVLLAYVGACHGDLDQWQRRWHDTTARLHPAQGGAERHTEPSPPGPAPAVRTGPRRRRIVVGAVAAMATLVALAGAVGLPRWQRGVAEPPATGPPGCPPAPPDARFTGVTYGSGAHVRAGATRDDSLLFTIPPHCTVGFTGFCVGEKVYDNTGGTPDVRWFKTAGGVVSSAVVHGNPPRNEPASDCPNGRPAPTSVEFSVTADPAGPGAVMLQASGRDLEIVGFAASTGTDPATPGERIWRQVSLADVRHPSAGARARLDAVPPVGRESVILVAAACFGGDSPTGLVEARQAHPTEPTRSDPVTLSAQQRTVAASSACRYPSRG